LTDLCKLTIRTHTANALYQRFETNIPSNETARPCSQIPHSCICERLIYSHAGSANAIQQNRRTDRGNMIHGCGNWERGRADSFLGVFVSNCWYSAEETNSSTTIDYRAIEPIIIVFNISLLSACEHCKNSVTLMLYLKKTTKTFVWAAALVHKGTTPFATEIKHKDFCSYSKSPLNATNK
jgi:hypothetical protein